MALDGRKSSLGIAQSCLTLGLLVALAACSKKTPEPSAKPTATSVNVSAAAAQAKSDVDAQNKLDPNDPRHGTRRLVGLDTPVFVDGSQVAVLRAGEMPNLSVIPREEGGRRFRVLDYLKAIGVDTKAIKSVHFHGNNDRIASLEGSELRNEKNPDRFAFTFMSGDSGAPLQRWDVEHLKNDFAIHEIRRITVYVNKAPAAIHPKHQCHVDAKGECTTDIPYSTGEVAKGTRVYLDGKMVGFVKRRQVTDAMIVGSPANDASENHYDFVKLLSSMNVDPSTIQSAELVAGDDVVARATREQLTALSPSTYFTLPKHNHGKVRVHVPNELQASGAVSARDALVSAVLLYKSTTPSNRPVVAISEDTDLSVQLAAIDDARGRLGRGEQ